MNVIKSTERATPNVRAVGFSPDDLIGRTFLKQPTEDGERFCATIVRKILEMEGNEEKIKFLLKLPDKRQDEIMEYNDIVNLMYFFWMAGKTNPSDVVSKHCGFADAWPKLKPLLFWRGDTSSLIPVKVVYAEGHGFDSRQISFSLLCIHVSQLV